MLRPPITIPIVFVQGMLSGVTSGVSSDATGASAALAQRLLEEAGIAPALLAENGARVTAGQYVDLFRLVMDRLDDEGLGLYSRPMRRGCFALVARSACGAPSLGHALRRIASTWRLLQDDVRLVGVADWRLAGLRFEFTNPALPRPNFFDELNLRVFWRLLAWLNGGSLPARRFDFRFALPLYAADYEKVFPAPLVFGAEFSTVWFDAQALAAPVDRDDLALRAFLQASPGNVILPRRAERTVGARVREALRLSRPAWPDLPAVARGLNMSGSTLQRHLAHEGVTFQSLKDELRRDLAIALLTSGTQPLAILAAELGFADSATFQRAFKSWTGSAPGSYRRR